MKRTGFILFLLINLALAFHSCSNTPKHPAELAAADSLCRVAKATDSVLNTQDTMEVKKMLKDLSYSLAYIQLNRKDTLSRGEGVQLSSFYILKKPLNIFLKKQHEIRVKNKLELEQCRNLAHDLQHNTLDAKLDARQCLEKERLRSDAISKSLASIFPSIHEIIKSFREQYPPIEARVKELKAKGGTEPPQTENNAGKDDDDE
jgi:hypothetical protein